MGESHVARISRPSNRATSFMSLRLYKTAHLELGARCSDRHQPRPERRPDLSVMKILETQLAEIGVILLVLAHRVSRSAMRLPSKRALYQEILFAVLQF